MQVHKRLAASLIVVTMAEGGRAGEANGDRPNRLTNGIGMELVQVRPGQLTIPDRGAGGARTLVISKPLYLGKFEVTQEQWQRVMGSNPSKFRGEERPVEMVSWQDCSEFCRKLSALEGRSYRLPTAAEWEYACRAGSVGDFCFGDDEKKLGEYAWYGANSGDSVDGNGQAVNGATHAVGQKKPNAWGFFDMHGNVMEWCQDEGTPSNRAVTHRETLHEERGTPIPDSWRLMGGGCYAFPAFMSRCSGQWQPYPDIDRSFILGFRVALDQIEQEQDKP